MPKTKRAQVVHLTKTSKKPKSAKSTLISNIHTTIHAHERIYAFSVSNMRNVYFQNIRQELKPTCRIFYGKNRVMAHALNTVEHDNEKVKEGLKKVALTVKGQIGLILSNMPHEELESHLVSVGERDFARAGCVATETITIPAGQLHQYYDPESFLPTTLEQQLKDAGMSGVGRDKIGHLFINSEYTICEEGTTLKGEQARLLKAFGVQMAEFGVQLICMCDMNTGAFEEYKSDNNADDVEEEDLMSQDELSQ